MLFGSIEEIKQDILSKMPTPVAETNEEIYQIFDNSLSTFYGEYSPSMYSRTGQLRSSLQKEEVHSIGDGYAAKSYYDEGFGYSTGASPSGSAVLSAAASGGHGASGLLVIPVGGGIWDQPIGQISGMAESTLVSKLIAAGIPLS